MKKLILVLFAAVLTAFPAASEDAVKIFSQAPADDLSRMIGYAKRAESPAAKKYFLETYKKGGSKFLDSLNGKKILAGGLSIAAITAAYKISDGTAASLLHLAKHHPEKLIFSSTFILLVIALVIGFPLILKLWRLLWRMCKEKKQPEEKKE